MDVLFSEQLVCASLGHRKLIDTNEALGFSPGLCHFRHYCVEVALSLSLLSSLRYPATVWPTVVRCMMAHVHISGVFGVRKYSMVLV